MANLAEHRDDGPGIQRGAVGGDALQPQATGRQGLGEGLAGWLRTTWMPFLRCVPDESRGQFLDEVFDAYLKIRPVDSDGLAHLSMVRLEVEAAKT